MFYISCNFVSLKNEKVGKKRLLYRSIMSILLLVVLLTPRFIKITHFLYVPHSHIHVEKPLAPTITNVYHSCHICAYKFAEIIEGEILSLDFINTYYLVDLKTYLLLSPQIIDNTTLGSRAPPFFF